MPTPQARDQGHLLARASTFDKIGMVQLHTSWTCRSGHLIVQSPPEQPQAVPD
jgi:hypothetical protein